MPVDENDFRALFAVVRGIDLFGEGPPVPPWGDTLTLEAVKRAVDANTHLLPPRFQEAYARPLSAHAAHLLSQIDPADPDQVGIVETVAGAVYDHGEATVAVPLHRFLAVVSNLYRSFLDDERRIRADLPLTQQLPPLVMFQHSGDAGPYTIPVDGMKTVVGAEVGVVSLPSTYRDHPLLWAALAHETGGHDVLHADPGLLEELGSGVAAMLGGVSHIDPEHLTGTQLAALLWSWWIDEAASDVYGLLNVGPAFMLNLILFFAALNARAAGGDQPVLRSRSGRRLNDELDVHPPDILRPHLAIGVIQSLTGLKAETGAAYVDDIQKLTALCAPDVTDVEIVGSVPLQGGGSLPLNVALPLGPMQEVARRAGAFIATAPLRSLDEHSVQDIETWDDADEAAATRIADILSADGSVVGTGDDAQLLAGATLAALAAPDAYDPITARLAEALDASFALDPYWGRPRRHLVYVPDRGVDAGALLDRYAVDVQLLSGPAPVAAPPGGS